MPDKRKRIRTGTLCILVGAAAIVSALAIWFYNDYTDRQAAFYSMEKAQALLDAIITAKDGAADTAVGTAAGSSGTSESSNPSYILLDGEEYMGIISIPGLKLALPVNNTWSYPALKKTPCRYSGGIETNDIVIVAHNYKTHFAKIKTLASGDEVIFTDTEGNEFRYCVAGVETVQPTDVKSVVYSQYDLTLLTCTYNGRARAVIRCERGE